jgi:regulatory protein
MTDNDIKIINNTISRLLAIREHSRRDLLTKLLNKNYDKDLCETQLDKYTQANLLSEKRFAEVMVRSRIGKGVSEQRIQRELAEHEISHKLIEAAFSAHLKKYGLEVPKDWQEQQKRNRFLQYRGFSHEQIRSVYPSLRTHLSA